MAPWTSLGATPTLVLLCVGVCVAFSNVAVATTTTAAAAAAANPLVKDVQLRDCALAATDALDHHFVPGGHVIAFHGIQKEQWMYGDLSSWLYLVWRTVTIGVVPDGDVSLDPPQLWSLSPSFMPDGTGSAGVSRWTMVLQALAPRSSSVSVDPFGTSALGLSRPGFIHCQVSQIQWRYPAFLFLGLLLAGRARSLGRSAAWYYVSGVTAGSLLGLLLLAVVILMQIKNRANSFVALLAALAGGIAVSTSSVMHTAQGMLVEHWPWVAGFVAVSALASFTYLYIHGVPTNPRVHNVFAVLLLAAACGLLWFSSSFVPLRALAVGLGLLVFVWSHLDCCSCCACGCSCCRRKPTYKPQYVSPQVMRARSRVATARGMHELAAEIRSRLPVRRSVARKLIDMMPPDLDDEEDMAYEAERAMRTPQSAAGRTPMMSSAGRGLATPWRTPASARSRVPSPKFTPDGALVEPDDVDDILQEPDVEDDDYDTE